MTQTSAHRKATLAVATDLLNAVRRLAGGDTVTNAEADRLCRSVGLTENKYVTLSPQRSVSVVDVAIHIANNGV